MINTFIEFPDNPRASYKDVLGKDIVSNCLEGEHVDVQVTNQIVKIHLQTISFKSARVILNNILKLCQLSEDIVDIVA